MTRLRQHDSLNKWAVLQCRVFVTCALVFLALTVSIKEAVAQSRALDCAACHAEQAKQFQASVHQGAVRCQQCHGGADSYSLPPEEARRWVQATSATSQSTGDQFDHGKTFRGKSPRQNVPMLCGACHADVERMNPYGLLTDQLASYWVSGHGKRLKQSGDTRVAVCIDCHGAHDVLRHDNPQSRTYFRNVPQTCARCHSDRALMGEFNLNPDVFDQYRLSVHGKNVLERGDSGSPTCATCHGSHAAAPPGYLEVSHVCGRCHKQIEDYFLTSIHGRIPVMARCIGCHGRDGDRRNHQIGEASPPVEVVMQAYVTARAESGDSAEALRSRFTENLNAQAGSLRLDVVCATCHSPARRRDPHSIFFESSDKTAREFGNELAATLRDAQFDYARTAERVQRLSRGVLLLKDEALRIEDAKTEVMALTAFIHTLNRTEIVSRGQKVRDICKEVDDALDIKETGVVRWRMASLPIWAFIAVFAVLMYRKYLELRRAYVTAPGLDAAAHPAPAVLSPGRRHFFDAILATMGSVTLVGLLWPAVAYVLPVGKRGGAVDRVSAGKAEGWATWQSRKISVTGKPVVVVRNDQGFAAYSAVCTHLGCIVHWNESKREFECPCHAARFDAQGQVLAGPPPTPLPPYSATVVQGEVIVAPAKTS